MYKIRKNIQTTAKEIEIIPTGDWHYGSPNCNKQKLYNLIKYVKDAPDCYVILMGDIWDCVIPKDDRFDPETEFNSLDIEYCKLKEMILPIKDKIICALMGNHEYKLHASGHGDLVLRLCRELSIPYGGSSCFIKIKVFQSHRKYLLIYAHHGFAAGRKTGNVINAVENLTQYYEADVYLLGHSHKLSSTQQVRIGWRGAKNILFCNTGTLLETSTWNHTSYSERAGYPPLRLGFLKLKYCPSKEQIYATE